jgi:hypothetical protein
MRKNYIYLPFLGLLLGLFSSCEKDLEKYDEEQCWLNFNFYDYYNDPITSSSRLDDDDLEANYSFITAGSEVEEDTCWFEVGTMGKLSDVDRPVKIQQVLTGENDAQPGVHYLDFNSAAYQSICYIPANQNVARIPIVMLRDASLKKEKVTLRFTIAENDYFKPGVKGFTERVLYFTDMLSKPDNWSTLYMDYYFGLYGPVKHQLMIEWSGEAWDEEYLKELSNGDYGYVTYLSTWFSELLEEANAKRLAQGLEVYQEEDGTPVTFSLY